MEQDRRKAAGRLRMGYAFLLMCGAFVAGCDAGLRGAMSVDMDAAPALRLTEQMRIGSADDPDVGFSLIRGVDVDRDGNVYVLESSAFEIRVYDVRGALLRRIGRRGSGPGEFSQMPGFGVVGDTVWTRESARRRITLFTRDGNVISASLYELLDVPLPPPYRGVSSIGPVRMGFDGAFYSDVLRTTHTSATGPSGDEARVPVRVPRVRYSGTGQLIDTVGWDVRTFEPGVMGRQFTAGGVRYYAPTLPGVGRWTVAQPDGRIHFDMPAPDDASQGLFAVTRVSLAGDTARRTVFHYRPRAFTEALIDSLATWTAREPVESMVEVPLAQRLAATEDAVRAVRRALDLPAFQNPVQSYFTGRDGSLWLLREEHDDGMQRWLVLHPDDTVRGLLVLPPSSRVVWARGDVVWIAEPDGDGIPWLVRYRIG